MTPLDSAQRRSSQILDSHRNRRSTSTLLLGRHGGEPSLRRPGLGTMEGAGPDTGAPDVGVMLVTPFDNRSGVCYGLFASCT
jgi:hypothetical protein